MKISKRDDFSLIFMSVLAQNAGLEKFVSLSYVARQTHLSALFLKHIALSLKNKGLIESREGIAGGYKLAKNPSQITVAEIITDSRNDCIDLSCNHRQCRVNKHDCPCYPFWNKVGREVLSVLQKITLSDFIKQ